MLDRMDDEEANRMMKQKKKLTIIDYNNYCNEKT